MTWPFNSSAASIKIWHLTDRSWQTSKSIDMRAVYAFWTKYTHCRPIWSLLFSNFEFQSRLTFVVHQMQWTRNMWHLSNWMNVGYWISDGYSCSVAQSTGTLVSYSYNTYVFVLDLPCLRLSLTECGVRQGGVLPPRLFNICIDDVIKHTSNRRYYCNLRFTCASIFMYADDLILMFPSATVLHKLFKIVEEDGAYDPKNVHKS